MKTYEKYLNEGKIELRATYESIDDYMDMWMNTAKKKHPEAKKDLKEIYQTWLNLDLQMKNFINEYK